MQTSSSDVYNIKPMSGLSLSGKYRFAVLLESHCIPGYAGAWISNAGAAAGELSILSHAALMKVHQTEESVVIVCTFC